MPQLYARPYAFRINIIHRSGPVDRGEVGLAGITRGSTGISSRVSGIFCRKKRLTCTTKITLESLYTLGVRL